MHNPFDLQEKRSTENSVKEQGDKKLVLKISINDLVLKACAETIKWHPSINTSWNDANILFHSEVNLAFGVAIDDGLLTPVINNADQLSLVDLSAEAKSLISKARSKRLMPDEMAGSTFTVTNLGMFGIDFFSGIINPPNAAILSIGTTRKKPTVGSCGNILVGETMVIGLSCDHRLVDGAIAAQFLQSFVGKSGEPLIHACLKSSLHISKILLLSSQRHPITKLLLLP